MKSNIQKVYSKLPKQELSAQKVELGMVDDIKKAFQKYESFWQKSKTEIDEAYTNIRQIERAVSSSKGYTQSLKSNSQEFRKLQDEIESKIEKAKSAAKEIGIDFKPEDYINYSSYNTLIKLTDGYQNDANLFIKFINGIPKINL